MRRRRSPQIVVTPARTPRNPDGPWPSSELAAAAGRSATPARTRIADRANVAASASSAVAGLSAATSSPPVANPTSWADWLVICRIARPRS